ncbi:MAG: glycosyltransferase family 4 protein, partial [Candidatus Hydrogenedentes bacterium]|nr:glycosyltransferase family 4 protein [Candidatus Hydrogenedentota bacterium]
APRNTPCDYAVFFGLVSPEKGIDTLLHAMKSLPSLPLRIVGEGPARPALEAMARDNALTQVEFCGYRDGDELKELIRNSAFVVVPSVWLDNSPLVIYEAHALGKPVIASDIGGIPELVEPDATGLLVPPRDPTALAEAMRDLAQDPARIEAMGRCARERIEAICASHYAGLMEIYAEAGRCHEERNVAPGGSKVP